MITYLEPLSTNLEIGEPSAIDLFDKQGILLLSKGKPITQNIRELLQRRQLYTLKYDLENSHVPRKTCKFSNSVYQDIVGYIRRVFKDTCLFSAGRIKETYAAAMLNTLPAKFYRYLKYWGSGDSYRDSSKLPEPSTH